MHTMDNTLNLDTTDVRQPGGPEHESYSQLEPYVILCSETGAVQAIHTCTANGAELWCDYYCRQFDGRHFIAKVATKAEPEGSSTVDEMPNRPRAVGEWAA